MLFRRRTKLNFGDRLKEALWPRGGWTRAMRYFGKRVLRLSGSPHTIAIGFAAGVFVAWSPLFGLHYLLAIACAFIVRGNVLAAVLSTTLGNPLTLPAMWALDYKAGELLLGAHHARRMPLHFSEDLAHSSFAALWPIVKPIFLGSLPLGLVTGIVSYFIVRAAVQAYQNSRRERLEARRTSRLSEAEST
jgi:uncharacterized protein (DUF2062 family)